MLLYGVRTQCCERRAGARVRWPLAAGVAAAWLCGCGGCAGALSGRAAGAGTIPASLGNLTSLKYAVLKFNNFTGAPRCGHLPGRGSATLPYGWRIYMADAADTSMSVVASTVPVSVLHADSFVSWHLRPTHARERVQRTYGFALPCGGERVASAW